VDIGNYGVELRALTLRSPGQARDSIELCIRCSRNVSLRTRHRESQQDETMVIAHSNIHRSEIEAIKTPTRLLDFIEVRNPLL
jgi:hypothetical protein